jgi:DNA-binding beta-propeller fold protein YncE
MGFFRRSVLMGVCGLVAVLGVVPSAQAAFDDPLFLMRLTPPPPPPPPAPPIPPPPIPPPTNELEGPCGIAVDNAGRVWVSDYYHDTVDLFSADIGPDYPYGYLSQIKDIDPLDGPCGLALDATGNLYVNDFHRAVIALGKGVIDGAPLNEARPTGIAIDPVTERLYVNERTRIAVFDLSGNRLGEIGEGSLGDGYGLAVSRFGGTAGEIYVPDAEDNTVKVYEPTLGEEDPIDVIDGADTPSGHFTSLRDAALAIDNASGEIYLTDNLQPVDASRPEAVVRVFDSTGAYEGRLKYSVVFGLPLGIAVDNSPTANQGRVYLTTSNTSPGGIYAYPRGAATTAAVPLPEPFELGAAKSAIGIAAPSASAGASPQPLAAPGAVGAIGESFTSAPRTKRGNRSHERRRSAHRAKKHHRPNKHNHRSTGRTHR